MLVEVETTGADHEWCVVEFQGQIVPEEASDGFQDTEIGKLKFVNGVPTLRIGHQLLTGKLAPLPKPFAVLEKHGGAEQDEELQYEVVGIARQRVLFASRPQPILQS